MHKCLTNINELAFEGESSSDGVLIDFKYFTSCIRMSRHGCEENEFFTHITNVLMSHFISSTTQ